MTVFFAGTEMDAFIPVGAQVLPTTAVERMDTTFSRSSVRTQTFSYMEANFAGLAEGWMHVTINIEQFPIALQDEPWVELRDSGTGQSVLQIDGDDGNFNLEYWNGSGFTEITPTINSFLTQDTVQKLDFHWKIADTDGVFELYIDEALAASFTGDTLTGGFSQIDQVRLLNTAHDENSNLYNVYFSETIVADVETIGWGLKTLAPNGDGNSTTWTGTFDDVDDITFNDDTFVSSGTAEEVELFTIEDLGPSFTVEAVVVAARSRTAVTGPQNLQMAIRTGGSNFFSSNVPVGTGFAGEQAVWDLNPNTGLPWTNAEIDALEIGVKSKT